MSIKWCLNKQATVYLYNEILLVNKAEHTIYIRCKIDDYQMHHA